MALGILRNGVPLDSIFGAKGASTAEATGLKQNGVDLNQYLLALADGTAISAVGLQKNGADFNTIFGSPSAVISNPGYVDTTVQRLVFSAQQNYSIVNVNSDGTWSQSYGTTSFTPTNASGNWYGSPAAGVGSPYDVQYTFTTSINNGAVISNGAPTWAALSSNRQFSVNISSASGSTLEVKGTLRIQIRRHSDLVVLSDRTINIDLIIQQ